MNKLFVNPGYYKQYYFEWANMYTQGESCQTIASKYGANPSAVNKALKKLGIEQRKPWEGGTKYAQYCNEWIELYEQGFSLEAISQKYGCSPGIVWHTLNKDGVERRSISEAVRKYGIEREDYFYVIDIGEKAYWLGFLMADGYIRIGNKNDKTINLALQKRDIEHIERFKQALGTQKIIECNHYDYRHDLPRLSLNSAKLYDDLVKHGCMPRKSLKTRFPNIPEHLHSHYVRGYFDGDGWITKPGTFGIVGGQQFLIELRDVLSLHIRLNHVNLIFDKRTAAVFSLRYGGCRQLRRIYDWLYADATIYLPRKKERFEQVISA